MRIVSTLVASLVLSMSVGVGAASAMSGSELLKSCNLALRSLSGSGRDVSIAPEGQACWTYMEAVQDMVALADERGHRLLNVCVPEDGRIDGLVRAFTTYAGTHSEQMNGRASVVVLQALWDAFPCRK